MLTNDVRVEVRLEVAFAVHEILVEGHARIVRLLKYPRIKYIQGLKFPQFVPGIV